MQFFFEYDPCDKTKYPRHINRINPLLLHPWFLYQCKFLQSSGIQVKEWKDLTHLRVVWANEFKKPVHFVVDNVKTLAKFDTKRFAVIILEITLENRKNFGIKNKIRQNQM